MFYPLNLLLYNQNCKKDAYRDTQESNQRKRTFMQKHGSLPEGIEEPPSLLDESIRWKLAKQLAGPPQWIRNYQEADEMMKARIGVMVYSQKEDPYGNPIQKIKLDDQRTTYYSPEVQK